MRLSQPLDQDLSRILEARHHDPFCVLGRHQKGNTTCVRVFLPNTKEAFILEGMRKLERMGNSDLFEWQGEDKDLPVHYRLKWVDGSKQEHIAHDPYTFLPQLSDFDLHLFSEGKHWHAYRLLGAREHEVEGVSGVLFAVWAPNAERVSVVGDFNRWDGRCHPMRVRPGSGVWELFLPDLKPGTLYKFEVRNRATGDVFAKTVVRILEMFESVSIVRQCLDKMPDGPIDSKPKDVPPGEGIGQIEAPRGECFHYIKSDGTNSPLRHKIRAPTYMNFPTFRETVVGETVSDATIILAAIDPCYCCTERMLIVDPGDKNIMDMNDLVRLSTVVMVPASILL